MIPISCRVGIQQRVLPPYRIPFFDALAQNCSAGLALFAGQPRTEEALGEMVRPQLAHHYRARNHHLFNGSFYFCYQGGLRLWLDAWQPEVLILESNPRYLRQLEAIRWMHSRQRPVIGWGLGAPEKNLLSRLARRSLVNRLDALITYSQQGAKEYRALGMPAEKIFTAPNAVSPRPTLSIPQRPEVFGAQGPIILFVGRLQARKRVDNLLHACSNIPERFKPQLWIVGDGPDRPDLEAVAQKIFPSAQFFGARYGDELDELFRAADLFVLPGSGGLAVQQAMSFGLPVIVAEADGTQVDLVRPTNGWQVTPANVKALSSTIQDALNDPGRLRKLGQESYRIVSQEINLENMVHVFAQAIKFVCTSSS